MNDADVKGFIVLKDFTQGIRLLSTQQKGLLMEALIADMMGEDLPVMDPVTEAIFMMMIPSVHAAQKRFQKKQQTARENGAAGGRPKKEHEPDQSNKTEQETDYFLNNSKTYSVSEKPNQNQKTYSVSENQNRIEENRIEENIINTPFPPHEGGGVGFSSSLPDSDPEQQETPPCRNQYTQDFVEFWEAYPRKVGKDAAYRAWKKVKRERRLPGMQVLLDAIDSARNSEAWQKDGGQYIPYPATWLNQGRWQDELAPNEEPFVIPDWAKEACRGAV